jgi:hypothetical protein
MDSGASTVSGWPDAHLQEERAALAAKQKHAAVSCQLAVAVAKALLVGACCIDAFID